MPEALVERVGSFDENFDVCNAGCPYIFSFFVSTASRVICQCPHASILCLLNGIDRVWTAAAIRQIGLNATFLVGKTDLSPVSEVGVAQRFASPENVSVPTSRACCCGCSEPRAYNLPYRKIVRRCKRYRRALCFARKGAPLGSRRGRPEPGNGSLGFTATRR